MRSPLKVWEFTAPARPHEGPWTMKNLLTPTQVKNKTNKNVFLKAAIYTALYICFRWAIALMDVGLEGLHTLCIGRHLPMLAVTQHP